MRTLVVEDDARLARLLVRALTEAGHAAEAVGDGAEGLRLAMAESYDVIVLDWMLPRLEGPEVCRRLRAAEVSTPVLMLTARGEVQDRVQALDAFADDYLVKPFSVDELLARLRALHRRGAAIDLPVVHVDDLHLDVERRQVLVDRTSVPVTTREFDVLLLLARRAGKVVTRQALLDEVWDGERDLRSNVIDVHIAQLRGKIDRPFGRDSIETVRGAGYRLRVALT